MAEGILDILKKISGAQISDKEKENMLSEELRQKRIVDLIKNLAGAQVSEKEFNRIMEMVKSNKDLPPESMMIDTTTSAFGDAGQGRKVPEFLMRDMKQAGGVSETRTLPPEFIEAAQKTFLTDLARQSGIPSITTATTQQPGETAQQFAQRQAQAQQFQITKAGMAELAPQVAPQDALQTAAL